MTMQSARLTASMLVLALLTLAVGGCATLGRQPHPRLPATAAYPQGQDVVLLLPAGAEGRLGAAIDAIESGYAAALRRDVGYRREPVTEDTSRDALAAYEAAAEMAPPALIIGPLLKRNVNAIAAARSAPTPPMLALNEATQSRPGMYQFALAPEHEASTAAQLINDLRGSRTGAITTAIVYPRTDAWGERMRKAFVTALDATPAVEVPYTMDDVGTLRDRVSGADLVFMVARPDDAAAVYAGLGGGGAGMPVIATSHAADNKVDATEKVGLFYVDVPWLVDRALAREYIARSPDKPDADYTKGELGRLYAMGIDAYYLGALVAKMRVGGSPIDLPAGMTGDLSFSTSGRLLRRQLTLGRIGEGGVTHPAAVRDLAVGLKRRGTAQAGNATGKG